MEEEPVEQPELSEFRMLDPVSKKAMYVGNILTLAVLLVAGSVAVYMSKDSEWFTLVLSVFALVAAAAAIYELASPSIFYKHYRYRMDEDCIEVRRGVIFHSHTLVPVERIHQVNVSKGPILRKFGLADVTITTAGGVATLQFLEEEVAEHIASNLNEKIVEMLRARE